jgi:uncharacterized protein
MEGKLKLLRFYVSNTDKMGHGALYQFIAQEAKKCGLAGTTVYKGIMGYGGSSNLVSDTFWMLTEKIPVVVDVVDEAAKIDDFVHHISPLLDASPKGCLVISQDVDLVLQKKGLR